ncbi:glycosyltransferase [Photobacterium carnosum]|uniref:glycosyltransferase n=1 Tax=Photobacterium carnosum TaxID=2023717 RepID=UPI001F468BE2|nr:glycosyltransferase family 2 protein [Photobacterium carnosum]MCF2155404.1 glycosyltransferase [Photobacterium carnosum]MCF2217224.1 glycosyltransferase [Photobacterium carnosum]
MISICIPTKNRDSLLKDTIDSIVNSSVDSNLYQIVISDNSDNELTYILSEKYIEKGYNIKYYKNEVSGFYNSIKSLLIADGDFLKLHNDYTTFSPGMFEKFCEVIRINSKDKPIIFFSNGELKLKSNIITLENIDGFIEKTSFYNTWSSAFSIWKEQLDILDIEPSALDAMFPHTSLLFQHDFNAYLVDDNIYFRNNTVNKKGGYNIFYNFCILYLGMVKTLLDNKKISHRSYLYLKLNMLRRFVAPWYYQTIYIENEFTFDNTSAKSNIISAYGNVGYLFVRCFCMAKKILCKGAYNES